MKLFIIYCLIIIALSDSSQAALYLGEYDFKIIKEGAQLGVKPVGGLMNPRVSKMNFTV